MSDDKSTIKRLEVTKSQKTLGVGLKPLGIFNDEFDFLHKKSKAYATRLQGLIVIGTVRLLDLLLNIVSTRSWILVPGRTSLV
jgi:hypothetical protein